jgi:hypothetical protein
LAYLFCLADRRSLFEQADTDPIAVCLPALGKSIEIDMHTYRSFIEVEAANIIDQALHQPNAPAWAAYAGSPLTTTIPSLKEPILDSIFRSRPLSALCAAPTIALVPLAAVSIFFAQYVISVCLGRIFGYPAAATDAFHGYPFWVRLMGSIFLAPFFETLIFQWAIIKLIHGPMRRSWTVAGLVSAAVFGLAHGHTDWRAVRMVATAAILALVFIIESRRSGPAIRATFLSHALFNGLVLAYKTSA